MGNIRNEQSLLNGIWDWEILDGCFGTTKIKPTDIDGFVERNGQFLVLEAKGLGKDIPEGQRYTFEALRKTGLFTIVIVWGQKEQPQRLLVMTKQHDYPYDTANLQTLKNVVSWWFDSVN